MAVTLMHTILKTVVPLVKLIVVCSYVKVVSLYILYIYLSVIELFCVQQTWITSCHLRTHAHWLGVCMYMHSLSIYSHDLAHSMAMLNVLYCMQWNCSISINEALECILRSWDGRTIIVCIFHIWCGQYNYIATLTEPITMGDII